MGSIPKHRSIAIAGGVGYASYLLLAALALPSSVAASPVAAGGEPLFADGFESGDTTAWCPGSGCVAPGDCQPLTVVAGTTTVGGSPLGSRTLSWSDAACAPRQAVMINQRAAGAGYLRRMSYRVADADRVITGIPSNGGAIQGLGYVTNHLGNGPDWGNWTVSTPGTTTVRLAGAHHAIVEYTMPGYALGGLTVPTTVQWLFATGRSHPLFTMAQDARAHAAGDLGGDSRSPYGSMNFPGDGTDLPIAGVSWGDSYKFVSVQNGTTDESTLLEGSSGWRYNQANSIPYVLAWTSTVDAEQGTVATVPMVLQDQGCDPRTWPVTGFGKNQQDLGGPFPVGDDWAYQLMNYPDVPAGGTTDKKIAWGTNFGALGGFDNWCGGGCGFDFTEYSRHRDSTTPWTGSRAPGLLLAYSTFVVFGTHTGGYQNGTTGQVVRQMENHQTALLSAAVGAVRTQGPYGVGPAANVNRSYSPAGYNPVYSTWEVDALADAADLTLAPAAGRPIVHPVFVVHGYSAAGAPATVLLDGLPATAGVDYFASVDSAADRLWLTVARNVGAPLHLEIVP